MKTLRMILAATFALALLAAPRALSAQVEVELTPFAGGTFFLADPPSQFAMRRDLGAPLVIRGGGFEDAFTLGVTGGFRFAESLALEGMFSWVPTSLTASSGLDGKVDATSYMYGLSLVYTYPLNDVFQPFLGLGVGGESFSYDVAGWKGHTEWMGNVLGGVVIPFGNRTAVRIEARDCVTWFKSEVAGIDDKAQNDLMVTGGLTFTLPFGR